jgi:hypothetical protein
VEPQVLGLALLPFSHSGSEVEEYSELAAHPGYFTGEVHLGLGNESGGRSDEGDLKSRETNVP